MFNKMTMFANNQLVTNLFDDSNKRQITLYQEDQ